MEEKTLSTEIQPKKISKRKKTIKKITLWILALFSFLLISAVVVAYIFEDKIADVVLKQLYKSIQTEVKHKDVSFSLIRKFPMASLKIDDLEVQGFSEKRNLLSASYVYLQFNIFDILTSNYKLKRIEISNANLRLKVFKNDIANWEVFSSKDSSTKDFVVNLNSILLRKVKVNYESLTNEVEFGVDVNNLSANGDFAKKVFDLELSSDLTLDSLKVDSSFTLFNKDFIISTTTRIDSKNDKYLFKNADIQMNNLKFETDFDLSKKNEAWYYIVDLRGNDISVKDILFHMPDFIKNSVKGYELGGLLKVGLHAKGNTGNHKNLTIKSRFSLKKGTIHNIKNDIGVVGVHLSGNFQCTSLNILQTSVLHVTEFTAILNKKNISGNFLLKNFSSPYIKLHLSSDVNLEDWQQFMPENYIYRSKGDAVIDIDFENQFKSFSAITVNDFKSAEISGNVRFSDVYLQLSKGETAFESLNGEIEVKDQLLILNDLNGSINDNTFVLNGKIFNFFDYVFTENTSMSIVADVSCPYLNMSTFLSKKGNASSSKKNDSEFELVFPDNINFDLKLSINKFTFDNFEAKNVYGEALLNNHVFTINDLNLNAFNGSIYVTGYAQELANKTFTLYCSAKLNNVDVQKMFYSFNNFGQSDNGLTDNNLRGIATTNILFKATTKNNLDLIRKSIDVIANITVTNGQLINFKPLESLSKFVELEDLRNIRFATLTNRIQISNEVITIPEMDIKNNALNLGLSGNQGFNGDIDYTLKIKMNELLSKKFHSKRKSDEDFGEVVSDGTGNTNIFITAEGNLDNPRFKWASRKSKEDTKEKVTNQKNEVNTLFKEEKEKKVKEKQKEKELNDDKKKNKEIEIDENW